MWDNVLSIAPAMAAREGFKSGDVASLEIGGRHLEGTVWVLPGQADHTVGATLGYGHRMPGYLCDGIGYNAAELREPGGRPLAAHRCRPRQDRAQRGAGHHPRS